MNAPQQEGRSGLRHLISKFGRVIAYGTLPLVLSIPLFLGMAKAQTQTTPETQHTQLQIPDAETQQEIDECMGCHSVEAESGPVVDISHLSKSPHAAFGCKSCHSSITEAPHTEEMLKELPNCADCHSDISEAFQASVHARPDKVAGDHPTCITCHGGGDPHSVKLYSTWTREDKVDVCSDCHRDKARMARYGPNVEAVSSYEHSFHGRALLKYDSKDTAICIDCHGSHGVMSHTDPKSTVSAQGAIKTCGTCHPGSGKNFAISGANHMDMTIHNEPVLMGVLAFFRVLVVGMASFLMLGVILDLKRSLFSKTPPKTGRLVGAMVSFGFLSLCAAISQATFGWPGGQFSTILGIALLLGSILVYKWMKRGEPKPKNLFDRHSNSVRVQHTLLVISFVTLIITGMPVRNPESETLRVIYIALGGLEVGRTLHRIAGVLLIAVFLYHIGELFVKWARAGFKMTSWTMLPMKKDIHDFITETRSYITGEELKLEYGRFHFREKLDYFAEYWGVPLMAITGLILWFPVQFGNALPPIVIPIAFIAHSYEAVLAFIAILTWHLYNSYFNLNHFALNGPWNIGILPYEAMEHKHPLELKAALENGTSNGEEEVEPTLEPEPAKEPAPEIQSDAEEPPKPEEK